MNKSLRCGVGIATGLAISLAMIQPAAASEPQQLVTLSSTTSDVIEASVAAASAFQKLGITPGDYYQAPAADRAYFDEVATLAFAAVEEPAATPSVATTSCTSGQRAVYAAQIAAINSARDANKRSAGQETMYMYLSHYIDMSPGFVGTTCDYNTEAPRYGAWITNDDRNAYDQFLATTNLTGAVTNFSDAISAAQVFQGVPTLARDVNKAAATVTYVTEAADFAFTSLNAIDFADQVVAAHIAGDTPAQAILRLENSFAPDVLGTYGQAAIAVAAALLAPMIVAPVLGVGLAALPVFVMLGTTIINQAALAGLLYSSNGRVTGRMMRYYGM